LIPRGRFGFRREDSQGTCANKARWVRKKWKLVEFYGTKSRPKHPKQKRAKAKIPNRPRLGKAGGLTEIIRAAATRNDDYRKGLGKRTLGKKGEINWAIGEKSEDVAGNVSIKKLTNRKPMGG